MEDGAEGQQGVKISSLSFFSVSKIDRSRWEWGMCQKIGDKASRGQTEMVEAGGSG